MSLNLNSPVGELRGVGEVRRKALLKLGIETVFDLLHHFPRAYQNRGEVTAVARAGNKEYENGDAVSLVLTIGTQPVARMIRRGMNILKFRAFDESGTVEIIYFNQNYLKDVFTVGSSFRFWGRVHREGGLLKMTSPIYEPYVEGIPLPDLVPVYTVTQGITQKFISGLIADAWKEVSGEIEDIFSEEKCREYDVLSASNALSAIHFPNSVSQISKGRERVSFEEVFIIASALAAEKSRTAGSTAPSLKGAELRRYTDLLPYELTGAQKRSLDEICGDMEKTAPMRRILIGDVGSGKTAVAAGAAFACATSGYQCAIMVPTEILARQHYEELRPLFASVGINVELLCGSTPAAEKRRILSVVSGETEELTGDIHILIGTHALISSSVSFKNLGLVITDEQHRFGVMQRAALAAKSEGVHILAMSATPIPRTLSLVYYGDLSLSRLDEMPPGRQKVDTIIVDERYRERLNRFIRTHAAAGNRTYVVCPMVEEGQSKTARAFADKLKSDPEEMADMVIFDKEEDRVPMKATVEFARELALKLPDLRVGVVHGKMKSAAKDSVMRDFTAGNIDVLVATTVVEVGVNVPEATLMIIENAERFGLSQLHQLRGRVGRGDRKSFCILMSDSKSIKAKERLAVMKSTWDGYEIAEADLRLRGAGDFFAASGRFRQHGAAANFLFGGDVDSDIVSSAIKAAHNTVSADPELTSPENGLLKEKIGGLVKGIDNTIS
ncbi:MAG: ATP-dependent DNA helicase RecG [Ruminococcaceae bacterium]|nr:ATP-dependent DNA helicase RecG [Oscillospiraceae bacterium]